MKKDNGYITEASKLRSRAEELMRAKATKSRLPRTEADSRRLLYELEVNRIELQMQNTELRQARNDAEAALERYADLYEFAPVGYFTLDRNGTIRGANLTGAALLGIERRRLIGRGFALLFAGEERASFTAFLGRVFGERGKEACEVALTRKNEGPLFVRIEAVADQSGEECRVAAIDISEQKRAEEELRLRDRAIMQQSRQAALGEMLGSISHHWRQPLNAVGLIIQELAYASECGRLTTDYLKASVEGAMGIILSLSQTLNDFRTLFIPDKCRSRFEVNQVVAGTVSFVEDGFKEEHISLDVKIAGDPIIDGYPHEYSQVLLNILLNARDALSKNQDGNARITVSSFEEQGKSVVIVTDNGGGIKKEIIDRIFEPYFTTKNNGTGTGVGLFMAKTFIENHMRGRLTARNVKRGAEFRIEV